MKNLWCRIGWHSWIESRPFNLFTDVFPYIGTKAEPRTRTCRRCGANQEWLPGYGGSGIGCWVNL